MKDITKMSKEEIMEARIKMPPTYRNLTKDEKNIQNYRNKLDDIILEVCEKEYKITGMKGYLWYQKDYNMCQEKDFKNTALEISKDIKERLKFYKKKEKKDIENDNTLSVTDKKDFENVLDTAIKNVSAKIEIVSKEYSKDIQILEETITNNHFDFVTDPIEIQKMKEIAKLKMKEIIDYTKSIICNKKDILGLNNLKPLTRLYGSIVSRTILENIDEINHALVTSNDKELGQVFIKAFNQNIETEKIKFLQEQKV